MLGGQLAPGFAEPPGGGQVADLDHQRGDVTDGHDPMARTRSWPGFPTQPLRYAIHRERRLDPRRPPALNGGTNVPAASARSAMSDEYAW
jgi:hypothetical protein